MRITITIDDALLARASELTELRGTSAIVRRALETLVALESAKRLALLGGTEPEIRLAGRRR